MAKAEASAALLPDAEARRAIEKDLGVSLLVEAAAGTGKTTSLVARMTELIRSGAATVDRISAVTFTIKAAAELSERFQTSLEAAARAAGGEEKQRLESALARLDSAFVGTIHAFCARLLRERPVEAGVDPGFAEMDEPENAAARLEAWDRYTERLFTDDSPILPRLAALNVRLDDLRQTYETLSENEDVAPEIGPEEPPPDFAAERVAVSEFLSRAAADLPAEMPPGGWTEYQEAVRRAARLVALRDTSDAPAFAQVLDALHRARKKGTEAGRRAQRVRDALPRRSRAGAEAVAPVPSSDPHARRRSRVRRVRGLAPPKRAAELPGSPPDRAGPSPRPRRTSGAPSRSGSSRSSSTSSRTPTRSRPRSSST